MPTTIRRGLLALAATISCCAQLPNAQALTIVPVYTSNVTSLPNFSSGTYNVQSAVNYVVNELDNHFSNPITLYINVDCVAGQSVLGESQISSYYLLGNGGYADLRSVLMSSATTPTQQTAWNGLSATDPTGGNGTFFIPEAQTEALGFDIGSDALNPSGTLTFGAGYNYSFDPAQHSTNTVPGNEIDFIGLLEHEFTEIMGRSPALGEPGTVGPQNVSVYFPYDLFRYTAPGVQTVAPNTASTPEYNAYFSIDGGVTNLHYFNSIVGQDPQDWQVDGQPLDAFNASVGYGQAIPMSAVDFTAMDVLGYDFVAPEPSTWFLFACGIVGVAAIAGRARRSGKSPARAKAKFRGTFA